MTTIAPLEPASDPRRESARPGLVLDEEFPCADANSVRKRVAESIQEVLLTTGYSSLRNVGVVIDREFLTLEGRVPTYYQKQLAQEIAQRAAGTLQIVNAIEVTLRPNRHQND